MGTAEQGTASIEMEEIKVTPSLVQKEMKNRIKSLAYSRQSETTTIPVTTAEPAPQPTTTGTSIPSTIVNQVVSTVNSTLTQAVNTNPYTQAVNDTIIQAVNNTLTKAVNTDVTQILNPTKPNSDSFMGGLVHYSLAFIGLILV
jgi:hypothetical protein